MAGVTISTTLKCPTRHRGTPQVLSRVCRDQRGTCEPGLGFASERVFQNLVAASAAGTCFELGCCCIAAVIWERVMARMTELAEMS
eukprot:COSAG02_NODE_4486_length_5301_cov_3.420223_2_plen_86_part_00